MKKWRFTDCIFCGAKDSMVVKKEYDANLDTIVFYLTCSECDARLNSQLNEFDTEYYYSMLAHHVIHGAFRIGDRVKVTDEFRLRTDIIDMFFRDINIETHVFTIANAENAVRSFCYQTTKSDIESNIHSFYYLTTESDYVFVNFQLERAEEN
jgi:transcription elongation factor Elf1